MPEEMILSIKSPRSYLLERDSVIYAMSDPSNPSLIKYIGRTTDTLISRLGSHIVKWCAEKNSERAKWIMGLVSKCKTPSIWPLERVSGVEASAAEKRWIKLFKPLGLFNRNEGEGAGRGHKPSALSIQKLIERNKIGYGRAAIEKGRLKKIGKKLSKEHIAKVMATDGWKRGISKMKQYSKSQQRPIYCVETGESFESVRSCVRTKGFRQSTIQWAIVNNKLLGGFHWKYKEKEKNVSSK